MSSRARKAKSEAQAQAEADAFNARVPVGTPVRYWPGLREGAGREGTVRAPAAPVSGCASCWVTGLAGSIALSHVEVIA